MNFNKLTEILLEVNLYDKKPLLDAINKLLVSKQVTSPEIINWFNKQFVGWYTSSTNDDTKVYYGDDYITPHTYKEGEPEWAKKPGIYDFIDFNYFDESDLRHMIDYFSQLDDSELKKIYKQPYEVITRKIKEWDEFLRNQKAINIKLIEGKDIETVMSFPDGYKFVKLLSKVAYEVEGQQMGHCAASYADKKSSTLFSLKDPKGMSHVTIEWLIGGDAFDPKAKLKYIDQIKGKENKAPVPKYIPYVKKFIVENDFKVRTSDGDDIDMVEYDGYYYFKDSRKGAEIWNNHIIPKQYDMIRYISSITKNNVIEGDINMSGYYFKEIPDISHCIMNGNFFCSDNKLTSLKGAPKKINGDFYCRNNKLTTLEGSPQVSGDFVCYSNELTTLEGGPVIVKGDFMCNGNNLTTLKGGPKIVGGSFYCNSNKLITLEGAPKEVRGKFDCSDNELISLKGAPQLVGHEFHCMYNPVNFTEEDIKKVTTKGILAENTGKDSKEKFKEYFENRY